MSLCAGKGKSERERAAWQTADFRASVRRSGDICDGRLFSPVKNEAQREIKMPNMPSSPWRRWCDRPIKVLPYRGGLVVVDGAVLSDARHLVGQVRVGRRRMRGGAGDAAIGVVVGSGRLGWACSGNVCPDGASSAA